MVVLLAVVMQRIAADPCCSVAAALSADAGEAAKKFLMEQMEGQLQCGVEAIEVSGNTVLRRVMGMGATNLAREVAFVNLMRLGPDPRMIVEPASVTWYDEKGKETTREQIALRADGAHWVKLVESVVHPGMSELHLREAKVHERMPQEFGEGGFLVGAWADWTKLAVFGEEDMRGLLDRAASVAAMYKNLSVPGGASVSASIGEWGLEDGGSWRKVSLKSASDEAVWMFEKVGEHWRMRSLVSCMGLRSGAEHERTRRQEIEFGEWVSVGKDGKLSIPRKVRRAVFRGGDLAAMSVGVIREVKAKDAPADGFAAVVPDGWTILDEGTRTIIKVSPRVGEGLKSIDRISK